MKLSGISATMERRQNKSRYTWGDCPKTQKSIPKVEDSAQYAITNRDDVISKNGLRFILV